MKTRIQLIVATWVLIAMTSWAESKNSGYYKGYELPAYTVDEVDGPIELRRYHSQLVAEVSVDGTREEAIGKGFRVLADYIFGNNAPRQKISMTTPVVQRAVGEKIAMTTPVFQVSQENGWVVQFGMPRSYTLTTLPEAQDVRIRFKMNEPKYIAAIRFSGRWKDALFNENKTKLEQFLAARQLRAVSSPVLAYYDDPFTLPWNRRNEILVEVNQ